MSGEREDGRPDDPDAPLEPTRTNLRPVARLKPGDRVADRYEVMAPLGVGGMGEVYRVRDEELEIEIALKVLRPEYAGDTNLAERFRREILLARQVTHENVVRIHDMGKDGDSVFLTMDLVEGRTLRDVLNQRGALPAPEVVEIGKQLAAALAAAHAKGVIHRDLKPSNVMLDATDSAYITDFGIARSVTDPGMTRTGFVVGTPDYLSPEQIRGEELDGRADIYSLGVLLFELLCGRPPMAGRTAEETVAQHLRGVPRQLTGLPEATPSALKAILRRCLEPDRQRRYADARALADDLTSLSRPPRQWPSWASPGRLALAGAALLAIGGTVFLLRGRREEGPRTTAAAAEPTTLVVLPFADETGRSELAWLGPGIPELLFEALVAQPRIRVVNPQRVARTAADLKLEPGLLSASTVELAAELFDSSRLLTGSVRSTPDGGLRIDGRLVDPALGLEAAVFLHAEASPGSDSAGRVVAELEAVVAAQLSLTERAEQDAPLQSVALPEYSEAVGKLWQGDSIGARDQLEAAVAKDPGFGAAWLRLSQAYEATGQYERALEAADRAAAALAEGSTSRERLRLLARAQEARLAGEPTRAQETLAQLVAAYPADIESAIALADAYGIEGKFSSALELLSEIVERAPANPQAWYLRAKYSILSGQSRAAVDDYLVRAMVLQNKLGNAQGRADIHNAFGVAYRELGEMGRAEESYQRAGELRRELGDRRGYATTLRNLSQIALFRGNLENAEESLLAAREIFEELGDEGGIADIYNELGVVDEARSAYEDSLANFRQALQIRRRLGDQRAIAESLNNIGFASHQLGRYDDASVYWQQALDVYVETGNLEGQVAVRQSLGQLSTTRGQWPAAQKVLIEALEGARQLDWPAAIAASQGYLGRVAQFQGRYAAALESYNAALARFEELQDARGLVEFSLALASTHLELGDTAGADDLLETTAGRLDASGSSDHRVEWSRLRSVSLRRQGDASGAAGATAVAMEAAEATGNRLLGLKVRLEAQRLRPSLSDLEKLWREARDLGDARLALESGIELARARVEANRLQEAETALTELQRSIRRMGDSADAYRIYDLRIEIAVRRGDDPTEWGQAREREVDRLGEGLPADLLETLDGQLGHSSEYADAA